MSPRPSEVLRFAFRSTKRVVVSVVGAAFVLAGLAMLVLPGPGILVIALGFAILGTEYAWAAAALARTRRSAEAAARMTRDGVGRVTRSANGAVRGAGRRVTRRR